MGQDAKKTLKVSFSMAIRAILKSRSRTIPPRIVLSGNYRFVGVSNYQKLRDARRKSLPPPSGQSLDNRIHFRITIPAVMMEKFM